MMSDVSEPTQTITIVSRAIRVEPDHVWTPQALQSLVGQEADVKDGGGNVIGRSRATAAEVVDDWVEITAEITGGPKLIAYLQGNATPEPPS